MRFPTGNEVTVPGIAISRICGKIAEDRTNYDAMGMMRQLRVSPSPEQSEEASLI